jgi:hypothetical protein
VICIYSQAYGVVFPFAISSSICRKNVVICSGLYFFIGISALLLSEFSLTSADTKNPGQVAVKDRGRG